MLHSEYRKDWRTDEEYANDIAYGHKVEKDIIEAYAKHLRNKYNMEVVVEDNGVDNSGEVIDADKVSTDADFRLNGILVEVKFMNNMCNEFRFKESQLHSYLKQGAVVLFVNGWTTDNPEFTVMKSDKLNWIKDGFKAKPFKSWGYKHCYFLKKYHFQWHKFEKLVDKQ